MLEVHKRNAAPSMAALGQRTSIVLLLPAPIAVGSRWHLSQKHPSPNHNTPPTSKRPCMVDPNNLDTKPETNKEAASPSTNLPGPPPPPGPAAAIQAEPSIATAPQLLCHNTTTTVLNHPLNGQTPSGPNSGSPSLGSLLLPSVVDLLVSANPSCSLVHTRLQAEVIAGEMEWEKGGKGKEWEQGKGKGKEQEHRLGFAGMEVEVEDGTGNNEAGTSPWQDEVEPPTQPRTYGGVQLHAHADAGPSKTSGPNNASASNTHQTNNPLPTHTCPDQFLRNFRAQLNSTLDEMEAKAKAAGAELEKACANAQLRSQI
ncbi:hypothetical protein FRC07_010887 [Ceratobasidium sp. 392]|nr:hypothetical protein FRC07_010887 [Ceratobasidium sp. 392]